MKTRIKCISCGSRSANWVKGSRFSCSNCGSFFTYRFKGSKCPVCNKEVSRNDIPGDYYEYFFSGKPTERYFHQPCLEKYIDEYVEWVRRDQEEIAKAEVIASLACPHCAETGIECYPRGDYDVVYFCGNCDEEIDNGWISEKLREAGFVEEDD